MNIQILIFWTSQINLKSSQHNTFSLWLIPTSASMIFSHLSNWNELGILDSLLYGQQESILMLMLSEANEYTFNKQWSGFQIL